ncbi:family 4 glycosyl hydrolase [Aggregatilinea lenta]|uniref:family 4 glycosyl hydrolase n=1 Tax=Aggregatilinea lenta TaxID=913108 RepID=UPI000E5B1B8D|nr:6-phospho-beta-glucosidase [Aggregatilinea lenta]
MKLTVIGGGSVRAPEFVRGALAFAADLKLDELWLMDNDSARLEAVAPLSEEIVRRAGSPFRLCQTTNLDDALRDADLIVTTIRVGTEQGRVFDERIALKRNVLGQETTGAGGFAMAMRNIPALLAIINRAQVLAPRAWIFNFTNPAGLVAQTLYDAGFRRVAGICDSANTAQYETARYLGVPVDAVKTEVYGLNHLSWTRKALVNGRDVLPELLRADGFVNSTHLRFFDPSLIERLGMFLNEYLFYFYYRDVAVQRIQGEERTRGEEVLALNHELFEQLRGLPPAEALAVYDAYNRRRSASYMAYAETDEALREQRTNPTAETEPVHRPHEEVGGYAGVALRAGLAITQDRPLRIGLNVANGTAIAGMRPDDVVEVTCEVDGTGIHPVTIGSIPEGPYLLMRTIKQYERLASQAILAHDRALAVEALVAHPLIGSYPLAEALLEDYFEAHAPYLGDWH